jgi:hypothetical protein
MRPTKPGNTSGAKRAWQAPAVSKLPIRSETKSAGKDGQAKPAHPAPPGAPSSKLGFAFEMAFPLSARLEKD